MIKQPPCTNIISMLCLLLGTCAFQGVYGTEFSASQKIWADKIRHQKTIRLLDDVELISMMLFSAQDKTKIQPRAAALTSIVFRAGVPEVCKGPLSSELLLDRARQLKGSALLPEEADKINRFYQSLSNAYDALHPNENAGGLRMDITFGLGEVRRLQRTIASCNSISESIAKISRLHGFTCDLLTIKDPTVTTFVESANRGIPVLLEQEGNVWLCFGYMQDGDKYKLLLNQPLRTPFEKTYYKGGPRSQESLDPRVIATLKSYRDSGKNIRTDYEITVEKQIPAEGFLIEPFEKGKYTAYVLMNWKRSAAAHDSELRKLLELSEPEAEAPAKLPAQPTDKDLWGHYVLGKEERLGGPYSLVPSIVFSSGGYLNQQYACLTSNIATQQGVAVGKFSLPIGKFYRGACEVMNDDFLLLKSDKKAKLEALIEEIKKQYEAKQVGIESVVEELDDPYLVAALRIKETIAPTSNIEKALAEIERLHGWKALLETAPKVSFDQYKEAIHKRIPIVLKDSAKNNWLLCVGYLRHDNKDMLLIVNPGRIDKSKALHLDNQSLYPGTGVYFEKFDAKKYQPYFIHDWHISVDAYKEQIKAVFADANKPTTPAPDDQPAEQKK